jgi:hypothetical protein
MSIEFKHEQITVISSNRSLPFPQNIQDNIIDGMVGVGTGMSYHQTIGVLKQRFPDAWMISRFPGHGTAVVTNPLPSNPETAEMLIEVLHEYRQELAESHHPSDVANATARALMESGQGKWVVL